MTDWRKLIGKKEELVLPYFGGPRVRLKDREVRLGDRPEKAGWYRFEVEGRAARVLEPREGDITGLPEVRGHVAFEQLFSQDGPERIVIMPEDEPSLFQSCTCARWWSGDLVWGAEGFDAEAEEDVRRAFAERGTLEWARGVPATLRAAFAWATARRAGMEKRIPCSPREIHPHASAIADGGPAAAEAVLDELEHARHGERIIINGQTLRVRQVVARAAAHNRAATLENAEERVLVALDAAHARFMAMRRLAGQQLEVRFDFLGESFVALVQALSLQVIDAGICLVDHADGHRGDDELTLESLPAAIREAMDLGVLVITRR